MSTDLSSTAVSPEPQPGPGGELPGPVVMVTPLWGRDGGVAAHVLTSAAALAGRGIEVRVLAARIADEAPPAGVTVLKRPRLLDVRAPVAQRLGESGAQGAAVTHLHGVEDRAVVELLRASSPVVVSAHGYPACTSGVYYFEPGHECTRAHGVGCVPNLIARGCAHTRYPRTLPRKFVNVTRGLSALRQADLVVSYSSAVDRHLAANGLSRRVIVPYFPTMSIRAGRAAAEPRRVVFAGRVERPKGVGVLIEAAAEVDADFVICGGGRQLEEMRELAGRLGIGERVRFTGWLGADQLAEEFAEASVSVVPSLWPEPFGIVGIESLASGRPAVASSTGGIVDWLNDGVCGIGVPPGDVHALAGALNELLGDPGRLRTMGEAGRRFVAERFSSERHVQTLLGGYRAARSTWLADRAA